SEDPGGLPYRWLIKGMIPLSFSFLVLSAIGYSLRNIRRFRRVDIKAGMREAGMQEIDK
ncbi:MAG: C4-dicarboxylate ABC transporter permease, partial [Candidatus Electrothrix sp. AX5]|nr:C4-dicarboxylate ABC transporter permease [Candidatus Electrothrix sp. AX5]